MAKDKDPKKWTAAERKQERDKKYGSSEPTPLYGPQSRKERYPTIKGKTKKSGPDKR